MKKILSQLKSITVHLLFKKEKKKKVPAPLPKRPHLKPRSDRELICFSENMAAQLQTFSPCPVSITDLNEAVSGLEFALAEWKQNRQGDNRIQIAKLQQARERLMGMLKICRTALQFIR